MCRRDVADDESAESWEKCTEEFLDCELCCGVGLYAALGPLTPVRKGTSFTLGPDEVPTPGQSLKPNKQNR